MEDSVILDICQNGFLSFVYGSRISMNQIIQFIRGIKRNLDKIRSDASINKRIGAVFMDLFMMGLGAHSEIEKLPEFPEFFKEIEDIVTGFAVLEDFLSVGNSEKIENMSVMNAGFIVHILYITLKNVDLVRYNLYKIYFYRELFSTCQCTPAYKKMIGKEILHVGILENVKRKDTEEKILFWVNRYPHALDILSMFINNNVNKWSLTFIEKLNLSPTFHPLLKIDNLKQYRDEGLGPKCWFLIKNDLAVIRTVLGFNQLHTFIQPTREMYMERLRELEVLGAEHFALKYLDLVRCDDERDTFHFDISKFDRAEVLILQEGEHKRYFSRLDVKNLKRDEHSQVKNPYTRQPLPVEFVNTLIGLDKVYEGFPWMPFLEILQDDMEEITPQKEDAVSERPLAIPQPLMNIINSLFPGIVNEI